MDKTISTPRTARWHVAEALSAAAARFPLLNAATHAFNTLEPREQRLATAIHRAAMRRWLTIEHMLNHALHKPLGSLEPGVRGVLLSGGAQILFFDRLPAYAVVDESVQIAKAMVRAGAGGLVNSVLRRVAQLIDGFVPDRRWTPASDSLLWEGGEVRLRQHVLPDPAIELAQHLSVVTSHPVGLVRRWMGAYGESQCMEICRHGAVTPPVIVAVGGDGAGGHDNPTDASLRPHVSPGFAIWDDARGPLGEWMEQHPGYRVQDPASALAVRATSGLDARCCVDFCAGLGTKTRQLLATHPRAKIIATDAAPDRLAELRRVFAGETRVTVVEPSEVTAVCSPGCADLLLLDVPCSNTGVLGRRPEARYRFSQKSLASLVKTQRRIIEKAMPLLGGGGRLLYSTCSLEHEENHQQTQWAAERYNATVTDQTQTLPSGGNDAYHDGSYFAVLKRP